MNEKQIIDLASNLEIEDFAKFQNNLSNLLSKTEFSKEDQKKIVDRILLIVKITNNPKTRESLIKSYYRIIKENIDKDGRNGSITVEITKRCNKNCDCCYSSPVDQKKVMNNEILNKIVKYTEKNYKHIFLTGGEPTLDNRVFLLAKEHPDIIFFMFTNGSMMTEEYVRQLSKLGNLIPLISINGSSEVLHDQLKGDGSYNEVILSIENLNKFNVSWGYISVVTEINAKDVLSKKFIRNMKEKGAFIARYLEYLPVGTKSNKDFILSGKTYYFLEKRKKEIIKSSEMYIQDTSQKKCTGLLSFDVDGNIKNCVFLHFAKYNIKEKDLSESIKDTIKDWCSFKYEGECPLYSDSAGFVKHLKQLGWKHTIQYDEEYLKDPSIARNTRETYKEFLKIRSKNN